MSLKLFQVSSSRGLQYFQPVLNCSPSSLVCLRRCQVAMSEEGAVGKPRRRAPGTDHLIAQQRLHYEIRNKRNIMLAFEQLLSQHKPERGISPVFYNLIKNCANPSMLETPADKIDIATTMVSEMKNRGVKLNVSIYNTLLRTYVSLNHPVTPSELLADMQNNGVSPNLGTLSHLIRAYCQQGNLSGAAKLLEHMKQNDLPISEDVYASLITGHAVNNDLSSAAGVLSLMRDKGHQPSNLTYQALLCAHAQYGDFEEIVKVREQMREENVFASTSSLIRVMDTLSLYNHGQVIPEVLSLVRNKQWILEDLRSLVCGLALRGEVDNALQIIDCLAGYNAVTSKLGHAVVRGMVVNNHSCEEILEKISWLHSELKLVQIYGPYRDLMDTLFNRRLSSEDQRAEDIASVVRRMMRDCGVDAVLLYPVFAHYASTGNIDGYLDTMELFVRCDNRYDTVAMEYLVMTLEKAGVSPKEFCESNQRVHSRLIKHLLIFFSERNFQEMANILHSSANLEDVFSGAILKGISVSMRQNYKPDQLPILAQVFLGLNKFDPKPTLDQAITIATFRVLWGGPGKDKSNLYEQLLKPLLEAEISVGESPNILLSHLARTRQSEKFLSMYRVFCQTQNVQLAQSIHDFAFYLEKKQFDKLPDVNLPPLRPLLFDLAQYNQYLSEGKMPEYMGCEQLLIELVKTDFSSALKIKQDMIDHGYRLNLTIYTRLIQHYAALGDMKSLQEELGEVNAAGYTLNSPIYTAMMLCYAKMADPEEVVRILEEVKSRGWPATSHMINHLLTAYMNSNDIQSALQVVRDYGRKNSSPMPESLILLFNEVIRQGLPHEDAELVLNALKTVRFGRANTQMVELEAYLEHGRFDLTEQLIKRPDFELKAGAFVGQCRRWMDSKKDRIEFAVKQLREAGIHRSNSGFALAMLKAYKMLADRKAIRELYDDLIANDCLLDNRCMSVVSSMINLAPDGTPARDSPTANPITTDEAN